MVVNFTIKNVALLLLNDTQREDEPEFLKFQTQKIAIELVQRPLSMDCTLALGGMLLRDRLYAYKDESLMNFISSSPLKQ